jgi:hypothetical protein
MMVLATIMLILIGLMHPFQKISQPQLREGLTACKALSHANANVKGINSKGWVSNQVF